MKANRKNCVELRSGVGASVTVAQLKQGGATEISFSCRSINT